MKKGCLARWQYFTINNYSMECIGPLLQPLTCRNQPQGIGALFGSRGGALHHAQGEGCHGPIESGQLGQQLSIFPDHSGPLSSGRAAWLPWCCTFCSPSLWCHR